MTSKSPDRTNLLNGLPPALQAVLLSLLPEACRIGVCILGAQFLTTGLQQNEQIMYSTVSISIVQ